MSKFLILGAGPAGLTFANRLMRNGERDFLVLEAENEAGGLCRSVDIDGSAMDTGGGHILDVRRPDAVNFLFEFMPREEWNYFIRDSRININGNEISHPFEANIWQLDIDSQVEYLSSIAKAGCVTGEKMPEKFTDWIIWKLGEKIAHDYMIPYNMKVFGSELDNLGTYWLNKLPDVSFEDTLRSCLEHKAYAKQPGHAEFYYPAEHGIGELWQRMADSLEDRVKYNQHVCAADFDSHVVRTTEGADYHGDIIINTIPYREFKELNGMPESLKQNIKALKHTSVQVKYIPENLNSQAQWIYYPDLNLSYHRIFLRHNVLKGSKGVWTETRSERIEIESESKSESKSKSKSKSKSNSQYAFMNQYAYPLNTAGKPEIMNELLKWLSEHKVYGLGRWGEHQHYNSDLTVELAMKLADRFIQH